MDSRPLSGHAAHSPIKLEVSLPSGWCETGAVQQLSSIDCLKIAAQQSLGQRFLRLVAPNGRPLDQTDCIWLSGLQDGDCLTAFAQQPKIAAARCSAFALWCVGGDRGVIPTMAVTAPEFSTSSGMFSRFVAHILLLLQSWQMEPWRRGASQTVAVTAPESSTSCGMFGKFVAQILGRWNGGDMGPARLWR